MRSRSARCTTTSSSIDIARAAISPVGAMMQEPPISACPSSSPALAAAATHRGVLVGAGLHRQMIVEHPEMREGRRLIEHHRRVVADQHDVGARLRHSIR